MTAVEWLWKVLLDNGFQELENVEGFYYHAKEMEKQQLNDAYNADRPNLTCYEENTAFTEYYNETFNNED